MPEGPTVVGQNTGDNTIAASGGLSPVTAPITLTPNVTDGYQPLSVPQPQQFNPQPTQVPPVPMDAHPAPVEQYIPNDYPAETWIDPEVESEMVPVEQLTPSPAAKPLTPAMPPQAIAPATPPAAPVPAPARPDTHSVLPPLIGRPTPPPVPRPIASPAVPLTPVQTSQPAAAPLQPVAPVADMPTTQVPPAPTVPTQVSVAPEPAAALPATQSQPQLDSMQTQQTDTFSSEIQAQPQPLDVAPTQMPTPEQPVVVESTSMGPDHVPMTIYSHNTQEVWHARRAAKKWYLASGAVMVAAIGAFLMYWLSIGAPTSLDKIPLIQNLVG